MLTLVDISILLYELLLSVHILLFYKNISDWQTELGINIGISVFIVIVAKLHSNFQKQPYRFLHTFYPIFLLILHYPQACRLRHSLFPFSIDAFITQLDSILFKIPYHIFIPNHMGTVFMEIAHFLYFSYYLSVAIPAWIVYRSGHKLIPQYLFVIIWTCIIHYWFMIFLPTEGPVPLRVGLIPDGYVFIPLMNIIYQWDAGGGAFPSLHVAGALISCGYGTKFIPQLKWFWAILFSLITLSTFSCAYHYTIDALAGLITGILCYITLPRIHDYITKS